MQQHSQTAAPSLETGGGFSLPEDDNSSSAFPSTFDDDFWPDWTGRLDSERNDTLNACRFYGTLRVWREDLDFPHYGIASLLMPKGADEVAEMARVLQCPEALVRLAPDVVREKNYVPARTRELLGQSSRAAFHVYEEGQNGGGFDTSRFLPQIVELDGLSHKASRQIEDDAIEDRFDGYLAAAKSGAMPDGPALQALTSSLAHRLDRHRKVLGERGFSESQIAEIWSRYPDAAWEGRSLTPQESRTITPQWEGEESALVLPGERRESIRRILNAWTEHRQVPAEMLATPVMEMLDSGKNLGDAERISHRAAQNEEIYREALKKRQAEYEAQYSSGERYTHQAAYAAKQYEVGALQSNVATAFSALHVARDGDDIVSTLYKASVLGKGLGLERLDILAWVSQHGIKSLNGLSKEQLQEVKAEGELLRSYIQRSSTDAHAAREMNERYGFEWINHNDDSHEALMLLRALEKDGVGESDDAGITRREKAVSWAMQTIRTRGKGSIPNPGAFSTIEREKLQRAAVAAFDAWSTEKSALKKMLVSPVQEAAEQVQTFRDTMHLVREYTGILFRNGWAGFGTDIKAILGDLVSLGAEGAGKTAASVQLQEIMSLPENERLDALLDPDRFLKNASEAERVRIASQGLYILGLLVGGWAGKPIIRASSAGLRLAGGIGLGTALVAGGSIGQDLILNDTRNLYGNALLAMIRASALIAGGGALNAAGKPVMQKIGQVSQKLGLKVRDAYGLLKEYLDGIAIEGLSLRGLQEILKTVSEGRAIENARLPIDRGALMSAIEHLDPNSSIVRDATFRTLAQRILSDPAYEPTISEMLIMEWGTKEKLVLSLKEEPLKVGLEENGTTIPLKDPIERVMVLTPKERVRTIFTWKTDLDFAPDLLVPEKTAQRIQLIESILDLREAFATGKDMTPAAKTIADLSTRSEGTNNRVVLGKWDKNGGGYVGEAKKNGGIWYETSKGVYDRIIEGLLSKESMDKISWSINENFLIEQIKKGVERIDLTGESSKKIMKMRKYSATASEIRWMRENAKRHGYVRVNNSWVKRK